MVAGRAVYLCSDCGKELGSIIVELCVAERPHLTERVEGTVTFILRDTPEVRAWLEAANLKAIEILRERRRQDRRDKGG
jgi:DNA-directed RNA polymerase subunit RPC12/RpoP